VRPIQAIEIFGNVSTPFSTIAILWQPGKIFFTDIVPWKPSVGGNGLNAGGGGSQI